MDEQNTQNPDPVTPPAGEANTAVPLPEPVKTETLTVEPLNDIPTEMPAESLSAPEITPEIAPTEPIAEIGTAQMVGNEPLPESSTEPTQPSAEAIAEAPQQETPTIASTPNFEAGTPEETPPKTEESPRVPLQTQQGSTQPETTPVSTPEPMPAQAQVISTPPRNIARLLLEKAKLTIQLRKQKKLVKIMNLFEKKKGITNDDIEKLLHVSDATATRYLSELEKQGKIIQNGKTGHAVTYTKT